MVKWISQQSSELSLGVRVPLGAQYIICSKLFSVFQCFGYNPLQRGYGLVVEHVLAKDEMGVRFSLTAQQTASAENVT